MSLTQKRLKKLVIYLPSLGEFICRRSHAGLKIGDVLGNPDKDGYQKFSIDGRTYKSHRLAFLYMRGRWPKDQVDHVNGVRDDNRWTNLRECSQDENNSNKLNVPRRRGNKFIARIQVRGVNLWLGTFDTVEAAQQTIVSAKLIYHPLSKERHVNSK